MAMHCLNVSLFEAITRAMHAKGVPSGAVKTICDFAKRSGSLADYEASCCDFMDTVWVLVPWLCKHTKDTNVMQSTTQMRIKLEKVFKCRYIAKAHLAVAMHILGFYLEFEDDKYFKANFEWSAAGWRVMKVGRHEK
jgi:hypothetical protein